jgi:hypothetical protein
MTKPRPWPNCAAQARDTSIMEASRIERSLRPVLDSTVNQTDLYRRVGVALHSAMTIRRELEQFSRRKETYDPTPPDRRPASLPRSERG